MYKKFNVFCISIENIPKGLKIKCKTDDKIEFCTFITIGKII